MKLHIVLATGGLLFCSVMLFAGLPAGAQDDSELWGGRDIRMEMTAQGATIEFDCGHGSILQPVKPNAAGEFSVAGTYTPERGGPIRKDNPPSDLPATYKGTISGDRMRLEILLSDKDRQPPPFTLTRGGAGKLMKCR